MNLQKTQYIISFIETQLKILQMNKILNKKQSKTAISKFTVQKYKK